MENIRGQSYPKEKLEVIIVDNGSTDLTRQVVYELIKSVDGPPIKYVFEPTLGYHNAVNRGALEAGNEIIVLVDDDILFEHDYLKVLLGVYQNGEISCAGGKIIALWEGGVKPAWIENHEGAFRLDRGNEKRFLSWPETIYGGSFSVRRKLFYKAGGFNPTREFGGNAEIGFCKKICDIGGNILWVPDAVVWHMVSAKTITHRWMISRSFGQGKSGSYTAYRSTHRVRVSGIVRLFLGAVLRQVISWVQFLAGGNYRPNQWIAAHCWGRFLSDVRLLLSKRFRTYVLNDDHLTSLIKK